MTRRDAGKIARALIPIDVRPGERVRVALVASYLLLVIAALVMLKSVRGALYLDDFGARNLPFVMIAIAVIVGAFVSGYIRLARRVASGPLTVVSLAVFVSHLVLFWLVALEGARWLSPVLFVWVGCFAAIAPVQVWTLTNELFTTREAKRTVSVIGSAGIVGGIAGGSATGLLASVAGSENLILVAALLLIAAGGLVVIAGRVRHPRSRSIRAPAMPRNLRQTARLVLASRHLKIIAGLVWIGALATTTVDFQYNYAADAAGFSRDGLASFFGAVLGSLSLAGLVVQLFVVRPVLQRAGVGTAILVLPLVLFFGTAALALSGSLVAATMLKAADGAFKHSIDRSAKELAWLPVPGEIKVSVKSGIDMILDRLGDGFSGLLMLVLVTGLGWGLIAISLVNAVVIGSWVVLALALRGSYRSQLGATLAASKSLAADVSVDDADALVALRSALETGERGRALAALDLARGAPAGSVTDSLRRLTTHEDPEIRSRAFALLLEPREGGLPDELTRDLDDHDRELLARSFDLALAESPEDARRHAIDLIGDASPEARAAMVALLVHRLGPSFGPLVEPLLDNLTSPGLPTDLRQAGAAALGLIPNGTHSRERLQDLLADPERPVAAAAAESASRQGFDDLAPAVVALLGSRQQRTRVRQAVRRFGAAAGPALAERLVSHGTGSQAGRRVAHLLAECADDATIRSLAPRMVDADPAVRHAVRDALAWRRRVRHEEPLPSTVRSVCDAALAEDAAACSGFMRLWVDRPFPVHGRATRFLRDALIRATRRRVSGLLAWLELTHSHAEVDAVRAGLFAADARRHENAIELLESLAPRAARPALVHLAETLAAVEQRAQTETAGEPAAAAHLLRDLAASDDPWLSACARLARVELERAGLAPPGGAPHDQEPHGAAEEEKLMTQSTTLVERVLALKELDMFATIDAEELAHLAGVARQRTFETGERIFEEGEQAEALIIVLEGTVALVRGEVSIGQVHAVAPLGAWSLFDDQPRTASAVAVGPVTALAIDRDDFFDVLAEHVEILRGLVGRLVHRLRALAV